MRPLALLLVVLVALLLVVAVAGLPLHGAPDAPVHGHVSARYLERGLDETGMRNLVTAVLLNYRAFDTFLEVVVLFTALTAVLALPWRPRPPGVAAATGPGAGDAAIVSPVVAFVVRLLAPFIALFAVATLYRGHLTPGGGFQSAAVVAALVIVLALVLGSARASRLLPVRARPLLQGVAPLAFALVALLGWRLTGAFLGFPSEPEAHALRDGMVLTLEVAIAVGGGVILARLFLAMEG
jgi:multicomponent Na+:H+ antiporter subunit B